MVVVNNTTLHYDKNVLKLSHFNNKIVKTIQFKNNVFKPSVEPPSKTASKNDILDILNKPDQNYDDIPINILPIDTISDLKKKIGALFNVSWYKITLFWYLNGSVKTSYDIYVNDIFYEIQFDNISETDTYLYNNKNDIYVYSRDEIINVNYFILNNVNHIYFILLDDFISTKTVNTDTSIISFMYYNTIIKYFPFFTFDLFYNYVLRPSEFASKYTDLINISVYFTHYTKLHQTVKKTKALSNLPFSYKTVNFDITNAISMENESNIDIRNIFDLLHVGDYDILKLVFIDNNKLYTKQYKHDRFNVKSYKSKIANNMVILYIKNIFNITAKPMFLSIYKSGIIKACVTICFNRVVTIDEIFKYMLFKLNSLLQFLNKYKYIFNIHNSTIKTVLIGDLQLYDYSNNIKCTILEKINDSRFNNIKSFNVLYNSLLSYPLIISNVTHNNNVIDFYIHSGISGFNVNHYHNFFPDKKNYYSIYYTLKDMVNWKSKYTGLYVTIIFNMNILEITIKNIVYGDIPNILHLLNSIINEVDLASIQQIQFSNKNRLKKLKAVDPNMYAYRDQTSADKKYSKLCQKPYHPIIYTKDDIADLPNVKKKKLVEFVNSTTKDKVYYECDSKKAPYLGFIVDKHPDNYCIPCCRIKVQDDKPYHKKCLVKYIHDSPDTRKTSKYTDSYILHNITVNRLSTLPSILNLIFNKSFNALYTNATTFYIYGTLTGDILEAITFCYASEINDINLIHKHKINVFILSNNGELDTTHFYRYDTYIFIYFDGLNYYPIINTVSRRTYTKDDDIVQYFLNIVKKNESVSKTSFFHFESIVSKFDIKSKFVNNRNYIYGLLITFRKKDLYIPILYYYNLNDSIPSQRFSESIINKVSENTVILFLTKHNLIPNITKYMYSNTLKRYIGLILSFRSYSLTFLFAPKVLKEVIFDVTSVEVVAIYYPIHFISEKINKNEYFISINEFPLNMFDIYYKNLYQLILHEISYYFYLNKNDDVRDFVVSTVNNNTNYNTMSITLQNKLIAVDYSSVMSTFSKYFRIADNVVYKNKTALLKFIETLEGTLYSFDSDIKHVFMDTATYSDVTSLFNHLFVFNPISRIKITHNIKNVLTPCSLDRNNDYCSKNSYKLIIPSEYKNKFISLFYYDINNSFKKHTLLNELVYINDVNAFDVNTNETLTVEDR